ncbi:hypothetical protein DPMN_084460 [Dreissena polymorpha]|uniref:Uncharacterized protein n=1 Tax=Dreissena polymorpha TaxID=45954 RepID=A0A9D3YD63_DREPO|nr:hypothetical protein DPMN_084460 [Dreissena polymorpha]
MYVILRFLYGIEVQVLSSTNLRKQEAFQRKILRHLQGCQRDLRTQLSIPW